jgi:adenine-specific DNA-methyltransferase
LRLTFVRANIFVMQFLKPKQDFSQIRNNANMSISAVADFLNVSSNELKQLESGERAPTAQQIAALGVMASLNQSNSTFLVDPKKFGLPPSKHTSRKVELAQFFTSRFVARFMAKMFDQPVCPVELLDAGAGEGALSVAFLKCHSAFTTISGEAHEIDDVTFNCLHSTLSAASTASHYISATKTDFIEWATAELKLGRGKRFSHSILNPPYKKISSISQHRLLLRSVGLETVNLYSGFVAMVVAMTKDRGEVVAIIPRSFCNGPYYKAFRKFILGKCAIEAIHIFERRNSVFSKDSVLQENVIVKLRVGAKAGLVKISESRDESFLDLRERMVAFNEVVLPNDTDLFIHIPLENKIHNATNNKFNNSLSDLAIECSTGPVVDFRAQRHLSKEFKPSFAPLLYPQHFIESKLKWPIQNPKKANAIEVCAATAKQLLPKG